MSNPDRSGWSYAALPGDVRRLLGRHSIAAGRHGHDSEIAERIRNQIRAACVAHGIEYVTAVLSPRAEDWRA